MKLPWVTNSQREQALEADVARYKAAAEEMAGHAYLIGIERNGRTNVFTFIKNGEPYQIETMGLIGDYIAEWKERLL